MLESAKALVFFEYYVLLGSKILFLADFADDADPHKNLRNQFDLQEYFNRNETSFLLKILDFFAP